MSAGQGKANLKVGGLGGPRGRGGDETSGGEPRAGGRAPSVVWGPRPLASRHWQPVEGQLVTFQCLEGCVSGSREIRSYSRRETLPTGRERDFPWSSEDDPSSHPVASPLRSFWSRPRFAQMDAPPASLPAPSVT